MENYSIRATLYASPNFPTFLKIAHGHILGPKDEAGHALPLHGLKTMSTNGKALSSANNSSQARCQVIVHILKTPDDVSEALGRLVFRPPPMVI